MVVLFHQYIRRSFLFLVAHFSFLWETWDDSKTVGFRYGFGRTLPRESLSFGSCCKTQTKIIFKVPVNNQFMGLMFIEGLTNNNNNNLGPGRKMTAKKKGASESFSFFFSGEASRDNNQRQQHWKALISTRSLIPSFPRLSRDNKTTRNWKLSIIYLVEFLVFSNRLLSLLFRAQ